MRGARGVSLLAVLLLLWSNGAHAAGKRIGVPKLDGKHEALVRKKVMQLLKAHGYELVRSRDMKEAIEKTGARLDSDDGLKTLARELALAAIITGDVQSKRAKIVVHNGADGSVLGDASFSGANPRKLAADVSRTFWRKLGADVGRGRLPTGAKKGQKASTATSPEDNEESGEGGAGEAGGEASGERSKSESGAAEEAPPSPAKEVNPKQETPAPEGGAPAAPSGLAWLDVELGGGVLNRSFTFNQNLTNNVFAYTLAAGPLLVGSEVVYPLDPLVGGLIGNLGIEAAILQGVGISADLASGRGSLKSLVHDFAGGLRYRFPFAVTDEVYVSGTVGEDAFTFSGANRTTLSVPDTIYHYVRPGVGVHLALGHGLSIRAAGGYRIVTNKGGAQISETFFRHLAVAGADGDLTVGFALGDNFEVRAGVEWRRYWYAMNSMPGDTYVAGGAVDQSFAFTARIAFLLGRVTPPKEAAGEQQPPPPPPKAKGRSRRHPSDGDDGENGENGTSSSGDKTDE